ncbi:MAG: hypothetical protein IKW39_03220 [Alphaproteobacteria bacterium]|nr:hypothetical protein [Alphaproteobacteria bacterium]
MSSVFKTPKVRKVETKVVEQEIVDNSETVYEMEKKRKKKMGAISQLISRNNSYSDEKIKLGQ